MTASESLIDFLRKARATGPSASDSSAVRDEWIQALSALMETLKGYLRDASEAGLLKIEEVTTKTEEETLGVYNIPVLRITAPNGRQVTVHPMARRVVGAEGRVDLVSGPKKALLVRNEDGEWSFMVAQRAVRSTPTASLSADSFSETLQTLLS